MAQALLVGAPVTQAKLEEKLAGPLDGAQAQATRKALEKLRSDVVSAQQKIEALRGRTTSLVGLEKPLITLRNPGIFSIPLGFLCVLLGSLLYRDRRAEEMWEELYVRQNTGIHAEAATSH